MSERYELIVCPWTAENPRHDHQLIFPWRDDQLMLVWCEYYVKQPSLIWRTPYTEGGASDLAPCRISARLSRDRGRSWSGKFTIQDNIGEQNVKHPSLLRLPSGDILFFFTVWNSPTDRRVYMKRSTDDCETWTGPVQISSLDGFHCINNDHVFQLSTGRIIVPTFRSPIVWQEGEHFRAFCYYSDDDGHTWQHSETTIDLPRRGAEEPSMVELQDGSLYCVLRTTIGKVCKASSRDGGVTWEEPEPTGLPGPASPPMVKRIPTTGDLLLIWNNVESTTHGPRNPLTAAISHDEGQSWGHIKDIENALGYDSAYAAVTFLDDEALVTYYQRSRAMARDSWLKLKILPIAWFYE